MEMEPEMAEMLKNFKVFTLPTPDGSQLWLASFIHTLTTTYICYH